MTHSIKTENIVNPKIIINYVEDDPLKDITNFWIEAEKELFLLRHLEDISLKVKKYDYNDDYKDDELFKENFKTLNSILGNEVIGDNLYHSSTNSNKNNKNNYKKKSRIIEQLNNNTIPGLWFYNILKQSSDNKNNKEEFFSLKKDSFDKIAIKIDPDYEKFQATIIIALKELVSKSFFDINVKFFSLPDDRYKVNIKTKVKQDNYSKFKTALNPTNKIYPSSFSTKKSEICKLKNFIVKTSCWFSDDEKFEETEGINELGKLRQSIKLLLNSNVLKPLTVNHHIITKEINNGNDIKKIREYIEWDFNIEFCFFSG